MAVSARTWFTLLLILEMSSIGRGAHKPEGERQYAHAVASAQKGDYWQALRDAEAVLRVEPGWVEARQLRRTAGFEAHYREALRRIAAGEWKEAQGQLENARTYSTNPALVARLRQVRSHIRQDEMAPAPEDRSESARLEARKELEKLDARAARIAAGTGYLASVTQALVAGDWRLVEQRIGFVPESVEFAPETPGRDLLPALQLYARGRADEARAAARLLIEGPATHSAAPSFLLFLNSHARRRESPAILACLGGAYLVVLLLSLYVGLRREAMSVGVAGRGATP
jgi:hypothetical protein